MCCGCLHLSHPLPLTAHLLESFGALYNLENFVSINGRRFYGKEIELARGAHTGNITVVLQKTDGFEIEQNWEVTNDSVVPFWAGRTLGWEIVSDSLS